MIDKIYISPHFTFCMGEEEIQNNNSKKIKLPRLLICLLILSLAGNALLLINLQRSQDYITGNAFRLIKPSEKEPIDSSVQEESGILHYTGLREIIEQKINEYNMAGNASVFLQDAKTGAWLGINERKGFAPASLLKIPIMMAILKKVEREEMSLKDKITLVEEDINDLFGILYQRGAGTQITVEELLKEMILSSDNTAKNALVRQLSDAELNAVFVHIGIQNPYIGGGDVTISARAYTRFFKSLYYSTFLSPELSERALDLTTDTQEEDLISEGVPPEIQVAHKFGTYYNEIHDCGIVYEQKNPYFLCIMTGDTGLTENNKKLISKISADIFEFVNKKQ